MTKAFVLVQTNGQAYSTSESTAFKSELFKNFPKATIEWREENPDFNEYLVQVPSKAMARKLMWELGRQKSLSTYWINKFYHFVDDETNEECKLYCHFAYLTKERRTKFDETGKIK